MGFTQAISSNTGKETQRTTTATFDMNQALLATTRDLAGISAY
jgi:hypothetical protein